MQGGKEHLQQLWEDMFQYLLDFIKETREEESKDMNDEKKAAWVWGGNIPTNYKTASGKLLGSWINTQRIAKRRGTLIEEREARLASTGLKWNIHTNNVTAQTGRKEEVRQQKWECMFQCLLQYIEETRKEETQHMNEEEKAAWVWNGKVPQYYKTASGKLLGTWVNTQRVAKKKGTLKDDREERLANISLRWSDATNAQPQSAAACPPNSSNDILQRKMANARGKGLGLSLLVPLGGSVSSMKISAAKSHHPHTGHGITQPGNKDCLFGREKWMDNHPGNKRYQQIIEENRLIYQVISKNEKKTLRLKIVNDWRANSGRFLKLNKTKMWEDIGDDKAQQYISLALREEDSTLMKAVVTEQQQTK